MPVIHPRLQFAPWFTDYATFETYGVPGEMVICTDDFSICAKTRPLDANGDVILDNVEIIKLGGGTSSGGTGNGGGIIVGNATYLLSTLDENGVGIKGEFDANTNTTNYTIVIKKNSALIDINAGIIDSTANQPNGPLVLGTDGKISISLLPTVVVRLESNGKIADSLISDTFVRLVWPISGAVNLTTLIAAKRGDIAAIENGASYILKELPPTITNNWVKISDGPSASNFPVGTLNTGSSEALANLMNLPAVSGIQQKNQIGVMVEPNSSLRLVMRTLEGFLPIGARWMDIIGKPSSMAQLGISDYVSSSNLGQPSGIATLDNNGKIPLSQIPPQSMGDVFPVNTLVDMNALQNADIGDYCYVAANQGLYIKANNGLWYQVGFGSVSFDSIVNKPSTAQGYGITDVVRTNSNIMYTENLPATLNKIYLDGFVKEGIVNYNTPNTYTMTLGKINYVRTNGVTLVFPVNTLQSQIINGNPYTPSNRALEIGDWVIVKVKIGVESVVSAANTLIEGGTENILRNDPLAIKFVYSGQAEGWLVV